MNSYRFRFALALGLIALLPFELWAQSKFSGLVILVQGRATLKRGSKSFPIKKDMLISEGDWIETKASSRVGLQLANGISTYIGPKTTIQIQTLAKGNSGRQIQMNLQKGSLTSRAKTQGKLNMKVQAPTLVAAVRGTEFSVDAAEKESSVAVNEGEVAVSSETGKVKETTIKAGEKIIATAEGARKAILDEHDKQKFRILQEMESMKKAQFEAYTDQLRRNEALRQHMNKSILGPKNEN